MEKITQENFEDRYTDPIERQEIDKFVCKEMDRQIHRYIKGMRGTKRAMDCFIEQLNSLKTIPEREKSIARYIDFNRKAISGLDFRVVLARAIANYCDTYRYMVDFIKNTRKVAFYLNRIKHTYIQFHQLFEENGKFGLKDHEGKVLIPAEYDFLRTCYVYVDDLSLMPVIVEKGGKLGLVLPDGKNSVVADFVYDDIELRDEYPYFEATINKKVVGYLDNKGNLIHE
ncbi:hypothetical protein [Segatella bryantii]|uniref:WG repeat-containing protein n=1 Tax=Segatella bryantii TaxID=77095 RepID=A0ABX4EJF3_SEGBR|nr:hypothetical protein [Segatella bryantii]OYP56447.1 hypothetical protein CIK91_03355 [Segatella bryantii]UKK80405.1 hypothetical protein L6474_07000 [Segatella bryantii]